MMIMMIMITMMMMMILMTMRMMTVAGADITVKIRAYLPSCERKSDSYSNGSCTQLRRAAAGFLTTLCAWCTGHQERRSEIEKSKRKIDRQKDGEERQTRWGKRRTDGGRVGDGKRARKRGKRKTKRKDTKGTVASDGRAR